MRSTFTMTMINSYRKYWREHPPTHLLAAAWMKYEAPKDAELTDLLGLPGVNIKGPENV